MTFRAASPVDSAGGTDVSSVTGTANQVAFSPTTGAVVGSLPAAVVAPGSVAATTQFLGANGTAALPSFAFSNAADTGLYLSSPATRSMQIRSGSSGTTANGGILQVRGGPGGSTSGMGGAVVVRGGTPVDGNGGGATLAGDNGVGTDRTGGAVDITAGNATGTGAGGNVTITPGTSAGGTAGYIILNNLPTSAAGLPAGALWSNLGILTVA